MIYLWKWPNEFPEELIGRYVRTESPDRFLFRKGEELPASVGMPRFEFDSSPADLRVYDVLPNSAQIPLISMNVSRLLLDLCPADIQLLEANIMARGQKLEGFKLVNATHLVSCIDHANSEYQFIPGTDAIMGFKRLKLTSHCLGSHNIARESEYKSHLYVSQQVKEAFDSNQWQGYAFVPPESVHP